VDGIESFGRSAPAVCCREPHCIFAIEPPAVEGATAVVVVEPEVVAGAGLVAGRAGSIEQTGRERGLAGVDAIGTDHEEDHSLRP